MSAPTSPPQQAPAPSSVLKLKHKQSSTRKVKQQQERAVSAARSFPFERMDSSTKYDSKYGFHLIRFHCCVQLLSVSAATK